MKRVDRLEAYAECMHASRTVRDSAARTGIGKNTAFRWRHALLSGIRARQPPLTGVVDAAIEWSLFSRKGARDNATPLPPPLDPVPVGRTVALLLGRARSEQRVASSIAGPSPIAVRRLAAALLPLLGRPCEIVAPAGPLSAWATVCRKQGVSYRRAGAAAEQNATDAEGTAALAGFGLAFRRWLVTFRGVATKYRTNYVAWHDVLARETPGAAARRGLRLVLISAALPLAEAST
jgi:hypothetical protein